MESVIFFDEPPAGFAKFPAIGNNLDDIIAAEEKGESPFLNIMDGFRCTFPGCTYAGTKHTTMLKHISKHQWSGNTTKIIESKICNIFPSRMRFFPIHTPTPISPNIQYLMDQYNQHQANRAKNITIAPIMDRMTEWDKRAPWPQIFQGINMASLQPFLDPGSSDIYVNSILDQVFAVVATQEVYIRRVVYSTTPKLETKPLKILSAATKAKYISAARDLIRVTLAWAKIPNIIPTLSLHDSVLIPAQAGISHMDTQAVHVLFSSIFKMDAEFSQSPIILLLGIRSWDFKAQRWHPPSHITPLMSALVYTIRAFILYTSLTGCHDLSRNESIAVIKRECKKWLACDEPTVFGELLSLKQLARTFAKSYYNKPNVLWADDSMSLTFDGMDMAITDIKRFIHNTIERCRDALLAVSFQDEGQFAMDLTLHCPTRYTDNWSYMVRDHGLIEACCPKQDTSIPRRYLCDGVAKTIKQAYAELFEGTTIQSKKVDLYLNKCDVFINHLALAMVVTCGMPMRGTELSAINSQNTGNLSRGLFIHDGTLAVICDYNKTESVSGHPVIILRTLPHSLGAMVIYYLARVRPFISFIRALQSGPSPLEYEGREALLFNVPTKNLPLFTSAISKTMSNVASNYIGNITLSQWRHIAIAIDKRHLRRNDIKDISHILQAGHTPDTEARHYALSFESLASLSDESLSEFKTASQTYHTFFDLNPSRPRPKTFHNPGPAPTPPPSKRRAHTPDIHTLAPNSSHSDIAANLAHSSPGWNLPTPSSNNHKMQPISPAREGIMEVIPQNLQDPINIDTSRDVTAADMADEGLKRLYGPKAEWRCELQREATIHAIGTGSLLVVMPTGIGKSVIIFVSAIFNTGKTTIVISPFVALRQEQLSRAKGSGIASAIWTNPHDAARAGVIFITPEAALQFSFKAWAKALASKGHLARVVLDEAHVYLYDIKWREQLAEMAWMSVLGAPLLLLSGSLPPNDEPRLKNVLRYTDMSILRMSCRRDNIRRAVIVSKTTTDARNALLPLVRQGTIVYTMNKSVADEIGTLLDCPVFHTGIASDRCRSIIDGLGKGEIQVVVATSGLGTGLDFGHINNVIHWEGSFSLID
ncbi:hypothetical protein MGYG_03430, partial [Nannizzia gypsea CBS 118893]